MEASSHSIHGVWKRRRRQFVTWLATVTFTVTTAVPTGTLSAQQVPVPNITTPVFNDQALDPYFEQARNAPTTAEWQSIIASGLYTLSASWEAQVDTTIQNEVLSVTSSDAFNSVAEYQDYLRKELEIQKTQALAAWESAALAAVANERSAYLTATDGKRDAAAADSMNDVPTSGTVSGSAQDAYAEWERKMQQQAAAGIADLGEALQNLENEYRDTMSDLNSKEAEFAQSLAQIEAYEKTVRDAIGVAVGSMESLLANNGMFYSSPGVLNQSGLDFQAFINQLKSDLDNNVPLSDLTLTMTTELEAKQAVEEQTVEYYNSIKDGYVNLGGETIWGGGHGHVWRNDGMVDAIALYIESGGSNQAPLLSQLSAKFAKNVISITGGMDVCGFSSSHNVFGILQIADARTNQCFSSSGNSAFTFDAAGCGHLGGLVCLWNFLAPHGVDGYSEERVTIHGQGYWWDEAAHQNELTHQSYVDTLTPITLDWRNNLLPAIQDWEAQVAEYESNYANFQNEAVGIRASATAAYEAGRDEILARRNAYASEMDRLYRQGRQQWAAIIRAEEQAQNDGSSAAVDHRIRQLQQQLDARTDRTLEQIERHLGTAGLSTTAISAQMQDAQRRLDAISTDFNRAGGGVDASVLQNLLQSFGQATTGVKNLSYAQAMHERAKDARDSAIERIADHVRGQDGEISFLTNRQHFEEEDRLAELMQLRDGEVEGDLKFYTAFDQGEFDRLQTELQRKMAEERQKHKDEGFEVVVAADGTVTMKRKIASGVAAYNGGDATSRDSYDREMMDQTVTILPPDAVRLASGGNAFEAWDYGGVGSDFSDAFADFQNNLGDKMQSVQEQITDANKIARATEKAYQQNVSSQVEQAKLIQTLAKAMLQGASFGEALASEMRSQAGAILGEAWGIPPSIISAILGGSKPHEAIQSYAEGQMMSALDQALGLPPGLTSMFVQHKKAEAAKKAAKQKAAINGIVTAAAVIAAPFTGGASLAAMVALNAAQGAVNGMQGGLAGVAVGAIGGALSGAVQFYTGGAVQMNLSYDSKNGFGGGVSVGLGGAASIGLQMSEHGDTSVTASVGIDTGNGRLGFQAGYSERNGFGGSLGFKNDSVSLGLNYSEGAGISAYAGAAFGDSGMQSAGIGYSRDEGFSAYAQQGSTESGAGRLSYSDKDGFGAEFKSTYVDIKTSQHGGSEIALNLPKEKGFSMPGLGSTSGSISYNTETGFKANVEMGGLTLAYSDEGGLTARADFKKAAAENAKVEEAALQMRARNGTLTIEDKQLLEQRQEQARIRSEAKERGEKVEESSPAFKFGDVFVRDMGGLTASVNSLALKKQVAYQENKKREWLESKRGSMTDEEWERLKRDPAGLTRALHQAGIDADRTGDETVDSGGTRKGVWDTVVGGVEDAFRGVVGGELSDADGYIDDQGVYHQRTCFVAGTLVVVHSEAEDAFEENGRWYKKIEDIREGDLVLSWNQRTRAISYNPVTETFVRKTGTVFVLAYGKDRRLETTWNHPFMIPGRGWVRARDLRSGDQMMDADRLREKPRADSLVWPQAFYGSSLGLANAATAAALPRILTVVPETRRATVYNFTVAHDHTYFVGTEALLVHNDTAFYRQRNQESFERQMASKRDQQLTDLRDKHRNDLAEIAKERQALSEPDDGFFFGTDGVFTNMGERFTNLTNGRGFTKDETLEASLLNDLEAEIHYMENPTADQQERIMAARQRLAEARSYLKNKEQQREADRDRQLTDLEDREAALNNDFQNREERLLGELPSRYAAYSPHRPSDEIVERVQRGVKRDLAEIAKERQALSEPDDGFFFGTDGVFTNMGERFTNLTNGRGFTKDETLEASLLNDLEAEIHYMENPTADQQERIMAARQRLAEARSYLKNKEQQREADRDRQLADLEDREAGLMAMREDVEKHPYTYEKKYEEKTFFDYAGDVVDGTLGTVTWLGGVAVQGLTTLASPLMSAGGAVWNAGRSLFVDDYDDLTDQERRYVARNQYRKEHPGQDIDVNSPELAEYQKRMEQQMQDTSMLGRTWRSMWGTETEADQTYRSAVGRAEQMLDNKEAMVDKLENLRDMRHPAEERMAFVTRDSEGFVRVFSRQEVENNEARSRLFYSDRPRVLVHGANGPDFPAKNTFDIDSMANYGNTISLFRDGSKPLEFQADVTNTQLLAINENRMRAAYTHNFVDDYAATPGFNIAAHSMGNPVLLDLLARDDSVFKHDGQFLYSREAGTLNILGVGTAPGSAGANSLRNPSNGFMRGFGWDDDGVRDLMEQNYDRLLDPKHPDFERYRAAREQYATVILGDREDVRGQKPLGFIANQTFGEPNDFMISNTRMQWFWKDGTTNPAEVITTHLDHEQQLHDTNLNRGDRRYIDELWGPVQGAPPSAADLGCPATAPCEPTSRYTTTWDAISDYIPNWNLTSPFSDDQETHYRPDFSQPLPSDRERVEDMHRD